MKEYAKSDMYPFHMPGHKRNIENGIFPYVMDFTEIYGLDNLHNPTGCIKSVMQKACDLYSVNYAYLLINGATGGLLSAVRALTNYGDKIIMARNCHKSVYNAVEICGLNAEYIYPENDDKYNILSSVKPETVEKTLAKNPTAKLLVITSPTYEGVVSDISKISKICRAYGVKLLVDEAHAAHFPFSKEFPKQAINNGADISIVSLHKTLPALTQTALLLTNDKNITQKIEENLSIFETSSPSYILMSSIEYCFEYISNHRSEYETYLHMLNRFFSNCNSLKHLIVYNPNMEKDRFFDFDKSKILIFTHKTNISGVELAEILRDKYKIETEMAYGDYVIAMTSVCDTQTGFDRLYSALVEIDDMLGAKINSSINIKNENINSNIYNLNLEKAFIPSEKYKYNSSTIELAKAKNRISLEYVWAYPPGIPLIVPGERITDTLINKIKILNEKGTEIFSTSKKAPKYINVVKD